MGHQLRRSVRTGGDARTHCFPSPKSGGAGRVAQSGQPPQSSVKPRSKGPGFAGSSDSGRLHFTEAAVTLRDLDRGSAKNRSASDRRPLLCALDHDEFRRCCSSSAINSGPCGHSEACIGDMRAGEDAARLARKGGDQKRHRPHPEALLGIGAAAFDAGSTHPLIGLAWCSHDVAFGQGLA